MMKRRQVVISLHGIRTRGEWQKKITPYLERVKHYPLDYGMFYAICLALPFMRNRKIKWFRDEYNRIVQENHGTIPSVIAHSFGTYILTSAMNIFTDIKFDKIVLMGSIVDKEYCFDEKYENNQYTKLLNIVCPRDLWVKLAHLILRLGDSGVCDFVNAKEKTSHVYEKMGHSDMLGIDVFVNKVVPFIHQISPLKNGISPIKIADQLSPRDVAFWSALTYKEQFLERFISSLAHGNFYENGDNEIKKPSHMNVIIPSHFSEANKAYRAIYFKDYKVVHFGLTNDDGRTAFVKNGLLYDIPSIIGTAEIFCKYTDESDAVEFLQYFSQALKALTKDIKCVNVLNKEEGELI